MVFELTEKFLFILKHFADMKSIYSRAY